MNKSCVVLQLKMLASCSGYILVKRGSKLGAQIRDISSDIIQTSSVNEIKRAMISEEISHAFKFYLRSEFGNKNPF